MSISSKDENAIVQRDIDRKEYKRAWYQKNKKRINESNRQYLRDYRKRKREEKIAAAKAAIERIENEFKQAIESRPANLEFGGTRPRITFGGHTY